MKKNLLRRISLLLILAMMLCAMPGFAGGEVEFITEQPAVTEQPAETNEPEATVEPEVTTEPEVTPAPEGTAEPEATAEPEITAEPTEVPEEELTTSPVDNSTTLPDGEYVPTGCTGGSSKVKFSCPKVMVKNGKATAKLVISSSKYDYVKAGGGKYATSACDGGVYANIPVDLNSDNRIVGHTTAMGGKEIEYTIHITLDESISIEPTAEPTPAPTEEPGEDTEHTVETDNKMFKIIRSVLTKKGDKYFARITLSGTGYDKVYCGTAEQAANDAANWISYSSAYEYEDAGETKTGYVFNIPVSAVNEPIPLAAHSVKKDEWMDRKVTFTVSAVETTPAPTEEPGEDTEHTVETDNKMFKIIRSVLTKKNGGYSAQITLSGTGYDKLYCGTAEQAANDAANWIPCFATQDYTNDAGETKTGYMFRIPVAAVNEAIPLAAYSSSKGVWYDRKVTFTVAAVETTPEPTVTPTPTPSPTPVTVPTPGKVNSSTGLADGSYSPDKFSWSGGSGRTSIACNKVTVKGGKAYATISFSSDSYAYVKANGQKYYGSVVGGRSTFEIPVKLNANNKIVGMTTAMSADHEIAYTIYVYIKDAEASSGDEQSTDVQTPAEVEIVGLEYISTDAIAHSWLYKVHRYSQGCAAVEVAGVGKYLIAPEGAELPVGIEEEATVIQQPVANLFASGESAMQLIQMIFAEDEDPAVTVSAWDYTAPDYAALLKSSCDLAIMPEAFADSENEDAAIADIKERLALLGIPMFVDRSADEESEAAKLEWIKVYGILLGCEEAANACYDTAIAALEVQV